MVGMERLVFQFKITLKGVKPAIWRRIQVLTCCTFWDLHVAIQDAMGWNDTHLHEFIVINPSNRTKDCIGIPDEEMLHDEVTLPGHAIPIKAYMSSDLNKKMAYRYDFGDGWEHELEFEGEHPRHSGKYPVCLAGERACPPEDVGGVHAYADFLEIISDQSHEDYTRLRRWAGKGFDPEKFEAHQVKFDDPKKRWSMMFE